MSIMQPNFSYEQNAQLHGFQTIVGIDEVGRGPLAGPVTAAAVILDPKSIPKGLNDSKKLSTKKRNELYEQILATADVSVAHASVAEIEALNIYHASHLAMVRAVEGLDIQPDFALVDGNKIPSKLTIPAESIVKGDTKSVSIAAASIAAKVSRDQIMESLAQQFPGYGWENNAGYPTPAHKRALLELGVTPQHRRSFKPVHNILYQEKIEP